MPAQFNSFSRWSGSTTGHHPVNLEYNMTASEIQKRLRGLGSPEAAAMASRFFKTGPGHYGEKDILLGLRAEAMHRLSKEYHSLPLRDLRVLLRSPVHEDRSLALLILVRQ